MSDQSTYACRKTIPEELSTAALKALQHYPSLKSKKIVFKYTHKASSSIMKAQPDLTSVLQIGDDRSYIIYVNRTLTLGGETLSIEDLPENVLKGWFGHELGHVMDYEGLSKRGLLKFGFGYLFSKEFVRNAENRADRIAIRHGLGNEIIQTKNFILNQAGLSEKYKQKIRKLYPSPEQIMEIIQGEKKLASLSTSHID
ncbi:MAG: hypothetical protein ACJAVN_000885 [Roseivirga sp.]|jgi:hypothetical protein